MAVSAAESFLGRHSLLGCNSVADPEEIQMNRLNPSPSHPLFECPLKM